MEEYVSSANKVRDTEATHPVHERNEYSQRDMSGDIGLGAVSARSLLGDANIGSRGNSSARYGSMQSMQKTNGNRAVQRFLNVQRRADATSRTSVPIQRFPGIPETRDPGSFRPEDEEAGILDRLFDLNPRKTFVESGLEGLLGEKSPAHSQEGDSTLTTLGRAGLSVGAGLLSPFAIFGGEILDTVNHPSHLLTGPFDRGPSKEEDGTFTPGNDAPLIPEDAPVVG